MLNTGTLFLGSASLINFHLSLPFQNVMVAESARRRRRLPLLDSPLSARACPPLHFPATLSLLILVILVATLLFSALLYLSPSHFLILSPVLLPFIYLPLALLTFFSPPEFPFSFFCTLLTIWNFFLYNVLLRYCNVASKVFVVCAQAQTAWVKFDKVVFCRGQSTFMDKC